MSKWYTFAPLIAGFYSNFHISHYCNISDYNILYNYVSGWWKALTKRLVKDASLPIGVIMDLLVAGKMLGWETGSKAGVIYDVKMKLMNESISQQNRMVLCKALERDAGNRNGQDDRRKALAHEKLTRAYTRAHMLPGENGPREITTAPIHAPSYWYFLTGVCFGTAATFLLTSGKSR